MDSEIHNRSYLSISDLAVDSLRRTIRSQPTVNPERPFHTPRGKHRVRPSPQRAVPCRPIRDDLQARPSPVRTSPRKQPQMHPERPDGRCRRISHSHFDRNLDADVNPDPVRGHSRTHPEFDEDYYLEPRILRVVAKETGEKVFHFNL